MYVHQQNGLSFLKCDLLDENCAMPSNKFTLEIAFKKSFISSVFQFVYLKSDWIQFLIFVISVSSMNWKKRLRNVVVRLSRISPGIAWLYSLLEFHQQIRDLMGNDWWSIGISLGTREWCASRSTERPIPIMYSGLITILPFSAIKEGRGKCKRTSPVHCDNTRQDIKVQSRPEKKGDY